MSASAILASLQNMPLGMGDQEANLQIPFNASKDLVVVRVRNLSATRKRKFYTSRISPFRGGDEYEDEMREKKKPINMDRLKRDAYQGMDVSPTAYDVKPAMCTLTFDNGKYEIPAVDARTGDLAPWTSVPEGIYDLYYGNYERLTNGTPKERSDEISQVQSRRAHDYVIRGSDDNNQWAFLEFERVVTRPQAIAIDTKHAYGIDLVEV